jgi:uncharacterized protein YceK
MEVRCRLILLLAIGIVMPGCSSISMEADQQIQIGI